MFNKVLIANRGEIAVRIIRACQEMGIATVAVYSEADRYALHVELADEAVCIGPAHAIDSYLNQQQLLSASILTGAEAIHPGFGFLSENSTFSAMCQDCQIAFIGPNHDTIELMGNKINARKTMIEAGVPVIPGSDGKIATVDEAKQIAELIGYPLMIKAAAGGGGKGIRKVLNPGELVSQFQSAQQEALSAFGNDDMYIEKIIYPARHIEIQILGDKFGNSVHLGERDCSLQRHNQKVLETAPAIDLSENTRVKICQSAVQAAKAVSYENAGTIEFLVDEDDNFYFMEMNTRIQVEHPVTEMITGIDIVKKQIELAYGQPLNLIQEDISFKGFSIECRINAEDPSFNFAPVPGRLTHLHLPSGGMGLRVESAMYSGCDISPYYDSMIAKIITHGETKLEAISKMQRALSELNVEGIATNKQFQLDLIADSAILEGHYDTSFLEEKFLPKWFD
ncbi:acetyl-CoA carboxylase biotin carboxylase subunit [Vagococcus fessus]|uniref:biotin carboxylase n=1 Tax=Vagococcus fessus TaxID=120370 RepID=A0A430ABY3_9ENTE|nr:acetyl-CoA carboxylase biotin carboxylase subunit [Vagococcus fessus]RSU04735.1 acetyl-CoA carboxylase biotin carboxylase subunit [Vagococcus fessus]